MELPYSDGLEAYEVETGDRTPLPLDAALAEVPTAEVLAVAGEALAAAVLATPAPLAAGRGAAVLTRLPARSHGFGGAEAVACMNGR